MNNILNVSEGKITLYSTPDGNVYVDVVFKDETFWMTQKSIAELFDVNTPAISKHLKNIFDNEELTPDSTISKMEIVQIEGGREVSRTSDFYSLDAIIAVGYRVNSKKATRFRQWATQTLKEYIKKGCLLNEELLKNGKPFSRDYFDELLEKIREIRASERRAYQKIADVFEQCSYDYDKTSDLTKDISIAKNYLNEEELSRMNRLVTMFIDYAELMAEDGIAMSMQDWLNETDKFLKNNRQRVLPDKGRVSNEDALKKADEIYKQFRVKQDNDYISSFDRDMVKYLKGKHNE